MERLIYRALAKDLIARSRARELLVEPLQLPWAAEENSVEPSTAQK